MDVITIVVIVFSVLGAFDYIIGGKFGLGKEFEKGFMILGVTALSMLGMLIITPWLASILEPVFSFVWKYLHIDPSVVPAILFANDMGGASLAKEVAINEQMGGFNALIVSSMMGVSVSYTIPYALGIVDFKQHRSLFVGILCGIVTIPVGCFVSGIILSIPLVQLLIHLIPLWAFSILLVWGLFKHPDASIKIFSVVGFVIRGLITIGLLIGMIHLLTGKKLVSPISPIEESIMVCVNGCVVLSGSFVLMNIVSRLLKKPLQAVGQKVGINQVSALGMISTLVSSTPTFGLMYKMDDKGVVLNSAFAVSGAFVFGAHLAFTTVFGAEYIPAMMIGKLVGGVLALFLANYIYERQK